jgi:hypothetical protein
MSDRVYACCEHCVEDTIHDVPTDGHEIACNASGLCSTRPGGSDAIQSLVAASKLAATYQHRAQVAEAALARVYVLCDAGINAADADLVRAAMKAKP